MNWCFLGLYQIGDGVTGDGVTATQLFLDVVTNWASGQCWDWWLKALAPAPWLGNYQWLMYDFVSRMV